MKRIFAIGFFPIFLASCGSDIAVVPVYKTVQAQYGTLPQTEDIIATVEGKHTADLAFKTAGRIKSVNVEVGSSVKAGDVLATLGNEEANITVNGLNNAINGLHIVENSASETMTLGKKAR